MANPLRLRSGTLRGNTLRAPAGVFISVPVKTLTITRYAPTLNLTVIPPVKTLTITRYAPTATIDGNKLVVPPKATLVLTSYAPTIPGTIGPNYPTVTLLGVPLAVRLRTAKGDKFVSREVTSLHYRSVIPGGYASCTIGLNRPLALDPDEIQLYGDLYIYDGRSAVTIWQGRLEDPGRASSASGEVWQITAVGPSAHARDRTVPLIYVDKSLQRWTRYQEAVIHIDGVERRQPDQGGSGADALHLQMPRGTVIATNEIIGQEYRAIREAGQKLARVDYTWDAGQTSADWATQLVARTSGTLARTNDHNTAGGGSSAAVVVTNFTNGDNLCEIRMLYDGAGGTIANDVSWSSVMGLYVMAMRFNKDATEKTTGYSTATVLASDIVADLLGRLLNQYDGANATVTTTSYAIEQLAYPDGATAYDILNDMMALESGHYWGAWEETSTGKNRFEWIAWPSTVRYEADIQGGFDSPGSAANLYNAVSIRWLDTFGRIRTNTRTQTVAALTDAGLTRTAFIDIADVMGSSLNADRIGDRFLIEHAIPPNAGTLKISEPILDRTAGKMAHPWELVPGHLIRVLGVKPSVDALNATARDAVTVFRIVSVDYDAGRNEATLGLDSQSKALKGLLSPMSRNEDLRKR